jgi:hypothetical protein
MAFIATNRAGAPPARGSAQPADDTRLAGATSPPVPQPRRPGIVVVLTWLVAGLLGGCVERTLERNALTLGLQPDTVTGTHFQHRIYRPEEADMGDTPILLIDGDGRAFIDAETVARDPTPRRSWLLALAPRLADLGPVIYLGRPCYHLQPMDPACNPAHWTLLRYGEEISASLAAAALAELRPQQAALVVGYSGGGVLAMEIARRLGPRNRGVITFAAPLDVSAWAAQHGYSPLDGSIDPANDPGQYAQLCQRHYFGARDREVSPELIAGWRWPTADVVTGSPTDHGCCWESIAYAAIAAQLADCANHTPYSNASRSHTLEMTP